MKFFFVIVLIILFNNCSFDNKTGIWENENTVGKKENNLFKDFGEIVLSEEPYNKTVKLKENFPFKLTKPVTNKLWLDIYYNKNNNLNNFNFNNEFNLIYKSKKISRYRISNNVLFNNNSIITSDIKGNLIIFSLDDNQITTKFNFYNKKYKKIDKVLNYIIENNIVYISDNIGFLYSFDLEKNEILWAKKTKVPFRSNLKLSDQNLIASNQNNELLFFNKINGDLLKSIPTEETKIKNQFKNNLSVYNEKLFFINTFGSLYSVNIKDKKLDWFVNLNQTNNINPSNLFLGNEIIVDNKKIISTSDKFTFIIDSNTGSIIHKKNFSSIVKPLVHNNYLLVVNKKNFLIALDIITGKIIYSYDLNQKVSDFFNIKKKYLKINNLMLLNNEIFIFLKNTYVLKLSIDGTLKEVRKFPSTINSKPIIVDNKIFYFDKKGKIFVIN
jgi:outer membrane protein assembly factor BamB